MIPSRFLPVCIAACVVSSMAMAPAEAAGRAVWPEIDCGQVVQEGGVTRVPLNLDEPAGIARKGEPVTVGVPLPRGLIASADNVRLLDEKGVEVPLAATPTAWWPPKRESLKWVLLDFQADIPAGTGVRYTLEIGKGVKRAPDQAVPPPPLSAREIAGGVEIDTGAMRLAVTKGAGFIDSLSLGGRQVVPPPAAGERRHWEDIRYFDPPQPNVMEQPLREGGKGVPSKMVVDSVTLEEINPLRAVVKVEGHYAYDLAPAWPSPFVVRIHAFAGQPVLRIFHTFVYMGEAETELIGKIGLGLPLRLGAGKACAAALEGGPVIAGQIPPHAATVAQKGFEEARLPGRDPQAGRIAGWLTIEGAEASVGVAVVNAARMFPKELSWDVQAGRLEVGLWPAGAGLVDLRHHTDTTYGVAARSNAKGLARTHEVWLAFAPAGEPAEGLRHRIASLAAPTHPYTTPRWCADSHVLGYLEPSRAHANPHVNKYEKWLRTQMEFLIWHHLKQPSFSGMMYWGALRYLYGYSLTEQRGAWVKYNKQGWNNGEQSVPHVIFTQYFRTGRREYWEFFKDLSRYYSDVTVQHLIRTGGGPGEQPYAVFGSGTRHWSDPWMSRPMEGRHTYNRGNFHAWWLSGDRRFLDVAREVNFYLVQIDGFADMEFWKNRNLSSTAGSLMCMWDATGEDFWGRMLHNLLERHRLMPPAADRARTHAELARKGFALTGGKFDGNGLLGRYKDCNGMLEAFIYYHDLTGEPAYRDYLIRGGDPARAKEFAGAAGSVRKLNADVGDRHWPGSMAESFRLGGDPKTVGAFIAWPYVRVFRTVDPIKDFPRRLDRGFPARIADWTEEELAKCLTDRIPAETKSPFGTSRQGLRPNERLGGRILTGGVPSEDMRAYPYVMYALANQEALARAGKGPPPAPRPIFPPDAEHNSTAGRIEAAELVLWGVRPSKIAGDEAAGWLVTFPADGVKKGTAPGREVTVRIAPGDPHRWRLEYDVRHSVYRTYNLLLKKSPDPGGAYVPGAYPSIEETQGGGTRNYISGTAEAGGESDED